MVFSNGQSKHAILFNDVLLLPEGGLQITIHSSKIDQNGSSAAIKLQKQPNLKNCPAVLTRFYLAVRPPIISPLFIQFNGKSLTRYQFASVLQKASRLIGMDSSRFSSHSFRIGCATSLSIEGVPDSKIMHLGRWKSNAYKFYIRNLFLYLSIRDFHVSVNFVYICVGSHDSIWIVGTSLIKYAFLESPRRPGRPNLCLDRFNTVIRWQSRNGMVTRQFLRQINMMRRYEDPPKRLVVHVGANDIGGSCPSNC